MISCMNDYSFEKNLDDFIYLHNIPISFCLTLTTLVCSVTLTLKLLSISQVTINMIVSL